MISDKEKESRITLVNRSYSQKSLREDDEIEERIRKPCCFLFPNMKYYYVIYIMNILNMFVTAISVPLDVFYVNKYS